MKCGEIVLLKIVVVYNETPITKCAEKESVIRAFSLGGF